MFRKKIKGVSATKSWEKSRIFRYGLTADFLSKGRKTTGGGRTVWIRGSSMYKDEYKCERPKWLPLVTYD